MKTLLIVNPQSGRGRANILANRVSDALGRDSISLWQVGDSSHEQLSDEASKCQRIVVIGGDGTLHHLLPMLSETKKPVTLIPSGTGNAFATALELTPRKSLNFLNTGTAVPRSVDLLQTNCGLAIFCAGLGMDAVVLNRLSRPMIRKWGKIAYLPAVLSAKRQFKPVDICLEVDGRRVYEGLTWLCLVTNIANLGASITIAPDARPDDGLLHVSVFTPPVPSILKMLWMLTNAAYLRWGVNVDMRFQGRKANIQSRSPADMELDGEPAGQITELDVSICPAGLNICY